MSRYMMSLDLKKARVPELYAKGEYAYLKGPRGVDPEPYEIYRVLGDGQYQLSRNGKSNGKIYRAEDLYKDPGYGWRRQSREKDLVEDPEDEWRRQSREKDLIEDPEDGWRRQSREKDLIEDPGYGWRRQSREVFRPAKRENHRLYTSPTLKPEVELEAPTGYQSGSSSVQVRGGTLYKDSVFGLPGLSDRSHVTDDDNRSPETPSKRELSEFDSSIHYRRIALHEAEESRKAIQAKAREEQANTYEERRNAKEERRKAKEERRKAREEEAKAREGQANTEEERWKAKEERWKAKEERRKAKEERRKARKEEAKAREERAKAEEVEINSHKQSDSRESLAKPLKMKGEEVGPNVSYGEFSVGGLEMLFTKTETEDGLQDLAGDTTVATGPGTKNDWIDSLLSKLSVGGVFSQLLRQSPPTGTRRWSFKSTLSAFGLGECLLERGKTRVRWRCVCGRKMYDDFIELRPGAAADLEKWLNHSIRNNAVNSASNPSQDYTLRSSNASSVGVSGQRQTAGSDISLQPLSWTASTMPDSDKNGAVTIDVHLEKCWLLICGQSRRGPDSLLAQLDLSSKPSDKELFDGMKELHSSLRNTFTLQPVLKGVQTIRFVQFQLHRMARVDIRKSPDMPPETRRHDYLYDSYDLMPPVGENLLTHWFQHPEEAWDLPYAYSLFPKKRKGQLDVDLSQGPSVAWGIQIVEGWLGSRIWLLSLSLFLCGSLAFGICWTVLKHDIQGAFGVAAYIVAFLTLVVGAVQANFG